MLYDPVSGMAYLPDRRDSVCHRSLEVEMRPVSVHMEKESLENMKPENT